VNAVTPHRSAANRTSTTIRLPTRPADWAHATALLHDYAESIRGSARFEPLIEQPSFATGLDDLAAHYAVLDRVLFLAYRAGVAVGTVAVACHGDGTAELKRMYVATSAAGQACPTR